jgi:hypothetical protein
MALKLKIDKKYYLMDNELKQNNSEEDPNSVSYFLFILLLSII